MNELRYENVHKALLDAVPELQEPYDKELGWYGTSQRPGEYIVFGFVLQPFLWDVLDSEGDPSLLVRSFNFFEEMARSLDIQVVNLLQVGIFESMVGDRARLSVAWKYMGEETKAVARRTARIQRREENLPEDARP